MLYEVITVAGNTRAPAPAARPAPRPDLSRSPALRQSSGGEDNTPPTSNPTRVRFPDCRLVVIGSSTGGPAALQQVLTALPADFPYPILLVQHMPKTFTQRNNFV